jgi:hypothetical protein
LFMLSRTCPRFSETILRWSSSMRTFFLISSSRLRGRVAQQRQLGLLLAGRGSDD